MLDRLFTSPLPTGHYTRLDNAASEASAANASAGRRFTVNPEVKKSQSFFPRMRTSFQHTMRRLGLIRPLPIADADARLARDIYVQFRAMEKTFRMVPFEKYPERFSGTEFTGVNLPSLHKAFSNALDRGFLTFADRLRETRREFTYKNIELPDLLCKTYRKMVNDALEKLSSNTVPYKTAMQEPMQELLQALKGSITPSSPASAALPSAPVLAAAHAPAESVLFEKDGVVCDEFSKMRERILAQEIKRFVESLSDAVGGEARLSGSISMLTLSYSKGFTEILSGYPSSVSMENLHQAHDDAVTAAVEGATAIGILKIANPKKAGSFMALMSGMRKFINAKVAAEGKALANRQELLVPATSVDGKA